MTDWAAQLSRFPDPIYPSDTHELDDWLIDITLAVAYFHWWRSGLPMTRLSILAFETMTPNARLIYDQLTAITQLRAQEAA